MKPAAALIALAKELADETLQLHADLLMENGVGRHPWDWSADELKQCLILDDKCSTCCLIQRGLMGEA